MENKEESERRIEMAFKKWCNKVNATKIEINFLKILFEVANAINVVNASYERYLGNISEETRNAFKYRLIWSKLIKE